MELYDKNEHSLFNKTPAKEATGRAHAEWIDGKPVNRDMPTTRHQLAAGSLYAQIYAHLRALPAGQQKSAFIAPFEVRPFTDNPGSIVHPDIAVCDKSLLEEWGCNGPPDMIAEVLSPATHRLDKLRHREIYCEAHVMELWFIDPDIEFVEVFLLESNYYRLAGAYGPGDIAYLSTLPNCPIAIAELFAD